ncbi:MAG: 4Fe-4S binding protein [Planctomycetes bacterium]|nr:4Fe-4S binding protein [Planctomycetota bacterium]
MTEERKIIHIDQDKCNGCSLCVHACHEGAIQMVDGKAKLVSDAYCDGLGDCLGPCPTGALSVITRPAEPFDSEAAAAHAENRRRLLAEQFGLGAGGCPGMATRTIKKPDPATTATTGDDPGKPDAKAANAPNAGAGSELSNWPIQLRLVPPTAPFLKGADILLAADCSGFAAPDLHATYLRGRVLIIACPKLEEADPQIVKLASILRAAVPSSLTVLRMEVPCCGGLTRIATEAVARSGLDLPVDVVTVTTDGRNAAL